MDYNVCIKCQLKVYVVWKMILILDTYIGNMIFYVCYNIEVLRNHKTTRVNQHISGSKFYANMDFVCICECN